MNAPLRHVMAVMDRNGHTTITWDPREPASCNDVRREFNRLVRDEHYSAFAMNVVSENGVTVEEKGATRVTEFDPEAGRYMMVPQLQGG